MSTDTYDRTLVTAGIETCAVTTGKGAVVETWPRTPEGLVHAMNRAAYLSLPAGTCREVRRADGVRLARYIGGMRADQPPGGIIDLRENGRGPR